MPLKIVIETITGKVLFRQKDKLPLNPEAVSTY
jgi:hypothetical protein